VLDRGDVAQDDVVIAGLDDLRDRATKDSDRSAHRDVALTVALDVLGGKGRPTFGEVESDLRLLSAQHADAEAAALGRRPERPGAVAERHEHEEWF
jgi:hypothetical protein